MPVEKSKIIRVVVDLILLISVALPILLFYLLGKPYQRGFFCNDSTISYNYKDSTVTSGALYAFGTIIPVVSIILIEYVDFCKGRNRNDIKVNISIWFWSCYRYIGTFLFGCALSHLTVDICKYSIGRLRPHFFDVCKPDLSKVDCSNNAYISEDICTNTEDMHKMREARLSFMSGHASFSAFTMFYLIIYLQARFRPKKFHLIRPLWQYLCFALAVYTCLTRISDYKHHWSDVLAGFINGVIFAFFTTLAIGCSHPRKHVIMSGSNSIMELHPLKRNGESQPSVSPDVNALA